MAKRHKTVLTVQNDDKYYCVCSFKENKKGELVILPGFAEYYSERQFGNPYSDVQIIDQHYTIHHSRENNEDVNVLNHTLFLKGGSKKNTRIYTRAFVNNLYCPIISVRGQDFVKDRYRYLKNSTHSSIDLGQYFPKKSTLYYMIVSSSPENKFKDDYSDLNHIILDFENFSITILWSFGAVPSHSTGNKYHKMTQPETESQLKEGYQEAEIINQYRVDRQLQQSSFLSFLQKEYNFEDVDMLLVKSLGFKKQSKFDIEESDKKVIEINYSYYSFSVGKEAYQKGRHAEALKCFSESRVVFEKYENLTAVASVLSWEARLHHTTGKSSEALSIYRRAMSIYRQLNSSFNVAETFLNLSMVYRDKFQNENARNYIQKAIEISKENGYYSLLSNSYRELGVLFKNEGDVENAEVNLTIALEYYDKEKNQQGKAFCLGNLGLVNCQMGNFKKSFKLHASALKIFKELNHQWGIANETANVGNMSCLLGDLTGLNRLKSALEMHKINGYQYGIATDLKLIGVHHATKVNRLEGLDYLEESRRVFLEIGNRREADSVTLLIQSLDADDLGC